MRFLVILIISDQWVQKHAANDAGMSFADFTRNLAKDVPLRCAWELRRSSQISHASSLPSARLTSPERLINVDGGRFAGCLNLQLINNSD